MYADMEQWTEIRRQVLVEGMSKRQACQDYQINWKTLQKVLSQAEPPGYRRVKPVRRPIIEPVLLIFMGLFVASILISLYLPVFSLSGTVK